VDIDIGTHIDTGIDPAAPEVPVLDVLAWVVLRDERMLTVRTRGRDAFYLPGGKREPGESDVAALRREVREELGVELEPDSFTLVAELTAPAHAGLPDQRVRMRFYEATGHGRPSPGREIEELAWLPVGDRARMAPAAQLLLDRLITEGRLSAG
jgi:8-oxo-dGTP pyrophosphatase MutT (NUDIX family)